MDPIIPMIHLIHYCHSLGVGTISWTRTPNPNYPNPNPNYPNPNYPITISCRNLRKPNLIRVLTPGTQITRTPLKPNRLWSNPLTWPQQRNKKFSCYIYWLLVCLICAIIAICWSYFCISSLFFTCCLMGETMIWQLIGYFGKTRTRNFGYFFFQVNFG